MEHRSQTRLVTAIVLVLVFASGVLVGFAADEDVLEAEPPQASESAEAQPEAGERTRRRAMYEQVGPTPEQMVLIDSIVDDYRRRRDALNDEYQQSYGTVVQDARDAIKGVFTPEQAAEYQRLIDEREARRRAERRDGDDDRD